MIMRFNNSYIMFSKHFLTLFALIIFYLPHIAQAQVGEPAIAPWSVDDTNAQSRIRQYQNFKRLQNQQALNQRAQNLQAQARYDEYQYSALSDDTHTAAYGSSDRILEQNRIKPAKHQQPSALETMYSQRIIDELEQFGYDLFGIPKQATRHSLGQAAQVSPSIPSGAVQDDFVLNAGDELEVVFSGQRNDRDIYKVSDKGLLIIKDLPPIPASGRTIGQVRISLEGLIAQQHNTNAYISLSSVRQIGVLVVGHVKKPGRQTLTVFHTVLDALMEAGGIDKTGSLRQIKLVRSGRSTVIDLYSLLMHGASHIDLALRDGDRLIIPPIGPTVAIAGETKRKGIFELLPRVKGMYHKPEKNSEKLSLNEMLEMAGGVLTPGKNRYLMLSVTPNGQEKVQEINNDDQSAFTPNFSDGAILMVSKGQEKRSGTITLQGNTLRPGIHALERNKTLATLLKNEDILGPDIYPLLGLIERWDPDQLARTFLDFPLQHTIKGKFDLRLHDNDIVHLFSKQQMIRLANADLDTLSAPLHSGSNIPDYDNEILEEFIEDKAMTSYLRERSAYLRGALRSSGAYPVSQGIRLNNVLAVSGGLSLEADTSNIEITSRHNGPSGKRQNINLSDTNPKDIIIGPGDSVRVNQKFNKISENSVLLIGEVKNPGKYDLAPGDKLSDLLKRAGGLTDQAYPYGAIFSRQSERKAEEARFKAQAAQIELAVSAALQADDEKVNAGKIAEARALSSELRNAQGVGRITIEADPAVLTARPELDLYLEKGDRIYIPKRNLTVRVRGEVLSAASLQFRERKSSLDYIHEAGGFTFHADKDRTFVIYPDGSAQPLQVNNWNYKPAKIPPGSTIVVPRDPKPFDFIQSAKDVSQILSNLAVTAIFIDDLKDD